MIGALLNVPGVREFRSHIARWVDERLVPVAEELGTGKRVVQFKLVDMLATLEQAQLYVYSTAAMADRGCPITREAAMAKIIAADGANLVCQPG